VEWTGELVFEMDVLVVAAGVAVKDDAYLRRNDGGAEQHQRGVCPDEDPGS